MSQAANYLELLAADRRRSILMLLDAAPAASANVALLHAALPDCGHHASYDQIVGDLAWLAEQGLVATQSLHGLVIARLLARGADVAAGRASVPGVTRRLLP